MRWILDNLQVVIAVAAALAYWLNQRKQESAGEPPEPAEEGRPDDPFREFGADPAEAERTRRIQEEIRRKIAERAGGAPVAAPARVPEPPPLIQPEPPPARSAALAAASAQEAILQRQRDLEDQLRNAQAIRRATQRKEVIAEASARKPTAARTALLGDLKGAENLRRAIVLREVLGPPVGLR
ncbi:MAG: hypothetical protein KIT44_06215 [Opitutaceae bacterium]|nr:hypothetical protein [Opitutaceae bacterium]